MSKEATLSSILTDAIEPDPEETCSETLKNLHPVLHEKLEAVEKRKKAGELTNEEAGWEVLKLFVEADFNPFLPDNEALLETC